MMNMRIIPGSAGLRFALLLTVLAVVVLLPIPTIHAQEGEPAPVSNAPAGITVLLLMMGLAALILVGVFYAGQNRPPRPDGIDLEE